MIVETKEGEEVKLNQFWQEYIASVRDLIWREATKEKIIEMLAIKQRNAKEEGC